MILFSLFVFALFSRLFKFMNDVGGKTEAITNQLQCRSIDDQRYAVEYS